MTLKKKIAISMLAAAVTASAGGGWYLLKHKSSGTAKDIKAHEGAQLYTCAMHPFIVKDKPGTCPVCNMALIKKIDGGAASGPMTQDQKQQAEMLGHVTLSPTQMVMANVATVTASQAQLKKEINAVGIVQYDQSRQAKVTAWVPGRIDKLHVNTIGAVVGKNTPVAEIYSPELVAAQQEYLLAVKSQQQLKDSPLSAISQNGEGLLQSAKQRLMLLGVKEKQISELVNTGKPNLRLPIYASQPGVVIEKLVQQGQYLNTGDVLFNVADLSTVWVEAEVYEDEAPNVRIGQSVDILSQSFPGRQFRGRISFIYPFLDPKTRTIKARVELRNPGMKLKPDMFVNAVIKTELGTAIFVPASAVIDTGKRQVVWVEKMPGMFEPRDVQVGQQSGDKLQILSGISVGDKVAVSGAYLIDSESQLRGGQGHGGHAGHAGGSPAKEGHGSGAAASPQHNKPKGTLSVDDMNM
ncbi:efflux RND transporter periplasmic adaptor subunit [Geomonas subterranea]|uniref:Efflux RND transporter periplasmic adaptor subunit n=1 Tax=Geomonas subterranea TaxID=2847989 RepID=A0ABX8LNZ4_9BACT|nr:efflux RND transporter periplasmic adaptor subunit [Geomonas subterranea]QXE92671.1 efflux RND transporter periplasmic adaptor subunit [Geomonas subterranea]QXM09230.1 efflux RND transporter periplasmic adaptor subunit [Geomonas subterranea]